MAHTISEVLAAVQAADAGVDSVVVFIASLKQQVLDALGNTITPAMQASLDTIFDLATADAGKLNTAMQTAPTPTP